MRKLRNKLLLSILTVALTFIALGTTTFAWFTLGGEATANAFTAQVKTPDGIEISLDETNWSNSVTLTAAEGLKFLDITTEDGINFVDKSGEETTGTYFTDIICVRTTNPNVTVSLEQLIIDESNFFEASEDVTGNWISDIAFGTFEANNSYIFNAINAVRVSFVKGQTAQVLEIEGENNHGSADNSEAGLTWKYAVAKKAESTISADLKSGEFTLPEIAAKVDTDGTFKDEAEVVLLEGSEFVQNGDYYYTEFTINVWLEGWDADCINAILNGQVTLGFKLSADFETPEGE